MWSKYVSISYSTSIQPQRTVTNTTLEQSEKSGVFDIFPAGFQQCTFAMHNS